MFFKTGALENFAIFTEKHLCWSLRAFLLKKRFQHRYFPVNIAKFLRTAFYRSPCYYTFPKFYVIIDIRYFRVTFYSRKNFAID